VAWNPVDGHLGIEGVEFEGDVIDRMGRFLARAAGEVGGGDYGGLVISKEVYGAVWEAVETDVFVAGHEVFEDGPQFGVEYLGGCSHGYDRPDFSCQASGYVVPGSCVAVELGAIGVSNDILFVAPEVL
jgi:hypothetical protein